MCRYTCDSENHMKLIDPRDMSEIKVDVDSLSSVLASAESWIDEYCSQRASEGRDPEINSVRALLARLRENR